MPGHDGRTDGEDGTPVMPSAPATVPFGSWPSPLSPSEAAGGAVRVSSVGLAVADDGSTTIRWSEQRPDLNGRIVVCRAPVPTGDEPAVEGVIEGPAEMSARSGVNEYGGGSWWADGDQLFWTEGLSGGIVTCDAVGGPATPVTTAPPTSRGWRHAAGVLTPPGERRWIVCEREVHPGAEVASGPGNVAGAVVSALTEPANELAVVPVDGGAPTTLVRDGDWAVAPALSPDGAVLAWLRWDHPDMPWDAAEVWAARVLYPDGAGSDGPDDPDDGSGAAPVVVDARRVAGGRAGAAARALDRPIAACLPSWSPDGRLWWCDDADDWWQLRCAAAPGLPDEGAGDRAEVALDVPGEVGEPRWISGGSRFGFTDDGRVVVALLHEGLDSVQVWDPSTGSLDPVPSPPGGFTSVEHLAVQGQVVAVAGGGGAQPTSAWSVDLRTGRVVDHRAGSPHATPTLEPASISLPEGISFPTSGGEDAHALFYPPCSASSSAPEDELPPLVVRIHGGPTASARAEYSTSVQFWTSRGFAVVDVNYRGSTGYGRRYRDLLLGEWGVADVEDCVAAVRWLADQGRVDGGRCVIRGGSAGGFTALEATCRSDVFAAACSLYGVTDLRALAADTHKFESRYLDGLVGPYPQEAARYEERSPLFHAELLDRPVLLLQGTDDPIVPPSQAEVLREALHAGGIPHALILFPGEAHGFRSAGTIVRALEAELAFYGEVLGFTPADDLPPLQLER
ncbi:S9 family peptidase [Dermatobacter hominis]|uniref:S9 family peptidase n=1 Tax=Dermatobacter hominis TaxID=2884263 RepID=UPI001D1013D3|nr:prolyl oligopeptidase family serine peptidase [Dermatobacter hominis]UDY37081.1 prolyl oligopeptidase family serine peptidase [Dermatobacter hominis]